MKRQNDPVPLPDQVPTQRELARIFGVSEALVSRLMRQRVLQRGGTLAAQVQAFIEREREAAAPPASSELETERVALTRARRQLAETEVQRARREVVPVDAMTAVVVANNYTARQTLLSWLNRLPPLLEQRSAREAAAILEDALHDLLKDMHDGFDRRALRVLRWLVKHAPADLLDQPRAGEDGLLAALDARLAEVEALEPEN